ncbi:MAG: AgmX/PglI C-terminal domain-containing protein [Sandaracinaceae bacterium]
MPGTERRQRGPSSVARVDAELCWGDERLAFATHAVEDTFEPGAAFTALRPFSFDGEDVLVTVPERARAWVRTVGGWRDLATLRVLGCVTPDPARAGACRLRLRRVQQVEGHAEGTVIVREVEAWLERDGFFLRVGLSDPVAPTPRLDRAAILRLSAAAALVALVFAGVLTLVNTVPPRRSSLAFDSAVRPRPRLPPVRLLPLSAASMDAETKRPVPSAPPGGRTLENVREPARPEPTQRTTDHRTQGRRSRRPPPARSASSPRSAHATPDLPLLRAAAAALTTDLSGASPSRRTAAVGEEARLRLATHSHELGRMTLPSGGRPGPVSLGRGTGFGDVRHERRVRARPHSPPYRIVPICDRRYCPSTQQWSCHCSGTGSGVSRDAIRRMVRRHLALFRSCVDPIPSSEGRLTLEWTIAADGSTHNVRATSASLSSEVSACAVRVVRNWTFGPSRGPSAVRYPLQFGTAAEVGTATEVGTAAEFSTAVEFSMAAEGAR